MNKEKLIAALAFFPVVLLLALAISRQDMQEAFAQYLGAATFLGFVPSMLVFISAYRNQPFGGKDLLWVVVVILLFLLPLPLFWYYKIYRSRAIAT